MGSLGKILFLGGGCCLLAGLFLMGLERFPGIPFGKLPGDIAVKTERGFFFFPITSMAVISLFLSLVFSLMRYFRK